MEISQFICVVNWSTAFFVMSKIPGFCLISGREVFRLANGFCRFLGKRPVNLRENVHF